MRVVKLSLCATINFALGLVVVSTAFGGQPIRVDISPENGRRDHLTPQLNNWLIAPGPIATSTIDGINFELRASGGSESSLVADWWKPGLAYDATMACDGVGVADRISGLTLTIRGLSPGRHTLVTYHNSIWDGNLPPIEIDIDGTTAIRSIRPSHRVTNDSDATSAYMEFEAQAGKDVVVEFRRPPFPADDTARPHSLIILNGFELDTVDPSKKALKPRPADGDEHVVQDPVLKWQPPRAAIAHDVYLGTNRDAVANATRESQEYVNGGRISGEEQPEYDTGPNPFAPDTANPFDTFYWRVDEVHSIAPEDITKGDVWSFRVRRLAFPSAEGYGRFARGGRGGRVIKVTNLNDAGPGSLRAAIEAEGPRTVVFDVSGRIDLQNRMVIRNPYLTIAGQTAPGKGICISNLNLGMLGAHDVIVRYIRVRPGDTSGLTLDGMGMASTDHSIIDHCSISWTHDEAFSSRGAKNITLQRSLISEALNIAGHKNYERGKQHGFAASIGGDIGSFHHNLLAHCAGRNWSLAGGLDKAGRHTGRLDIRNNVVYNWGHRTTDGGARQVNFVNNYYKPGPASRVFHVLMPERHLIHAFGPQNYYVAGNVMEGHYAADQPLDGVKASRNEPMEDFLVAEPFFESHVTTQSAEEAFEDVLADVGCNLPMLDEHDRRVIEETRRSTTTYKGSISGLPGLPDSQKDVGGWEDYPEVHRPADWDTDNDGMPSTWETQRGLNPLDSNDGNLDEDGDGYTNLEEYLNDIGR